MDKCPAKASTLSPSVTSRKLLLMQMPRVHSGQNGALARCSPRQAAPHLQPRLPQHYTTLPFTFWVCHLRASKGEQVSADINYSWSKAG